MTKIKPLTTQYVFREPPQNFNPKIEVAACFIFVENKVLFLKRVPHVHEGNVWGIPGGKCEKNEEAAKAVVREIFEETQIELSGASLKTFGKVYIRYPEIDFIYHMFESSFRTFPKAVLNPEEHTEHNWLSLHEALELPLIRGEDECIHLYYKLVCEEG